LKKQVDYKIILDTNILYELTRRYTGFADGKVMHIEGILKNHCANIVVPDLVWAEFSAAFFQKGFPYENYAKWYDNRLTAFMKVYRTINIDAKAEYLRTANLNSVNSVDYLELAREIASIKFSEDFINKENAKMLNEIKEAQDRTEPKSAQEEKKRCEFIERQEHQLRKGKLLDGMDAQIFSAGVLYALQNSERSIYIFTLDKFFKSAASHLCSHVSTYDKICSLLSSLNNNESGDPEAVDSLSLSNLRIISIKDSFRVPVT